MTQQAAHFIRSGLLQGFGMSISARAKDVLVEPGQPLFADHLKSEQNCTVFTTKKSFWEFGLKAATMKSINKKLFRNEWAYLDNLYGFSLSNERNTSMRMQWADAVATDTMRLWRYGLRAIREDRTAKDPNLQILRTLYKSLKSTVLFEPDSDDDHTNSDGEDYDFEELNETPATDPKNNKDTLSDVEFENEFEEEEEAVDSSEMGSPSPLRGPGDLFDNDNAMTCSVSDNAPDVARVSAREPARSPSASAPPGPAPPAPAGAAGGPGLRRTLTPASLQPIIDAMPPADTMTHMRMFKRPAGQALKRPAACEGCEDEKDEGDADEGDADECVFVGMKKAKKNFLPILRIAIPADVRKLLTEKMKEEPKPETWINHLIERETSEYYQIKDSPNQKGCTIQVSSGQFGSLTHIGASVLAILVQEGYNRNACELVKSFLLSPADAHVY